jgi:light-regulated signal transduction histidine kinase (bacteriophytochrome)
VNPIVIFAMFIICCGGTHALDGVMFYWPNYRLLGVGLSTTAIVSAIAVITTAVWMPKFLSNERDSQIEKEEFMKVLQLKTHELEERTKDLEHSNQELERFAYIAAHDLQDPLRTMTAFLSLLVKKYPQEDAKDYIDIIVDSNNKMKNMTTNLLTYAKLQDVQFTVEIVKTDSLLDGVCKSLGLLIAEAGAQIVYHELPEIKVDKIQVERLFQNLIQNAIKYRDRSRQLVVSIEGERVGDNFEFEVKDNGAGFDVSQKETFYVFRRVRPNDKGVGFGLAICKRIVERHGGTISAVSVVGEGSTIKISLPVEPLVEKRTRPHSYTDI